MLDARGTDLNKARSLKLRDSQQEGVAVEKSCVKQGESRPEGECTHLPQAGRTLCLCASPAAS